MSSLNKKLRFETLAVHAGHKIDPSTGAVVAPIHMSTTFERDVDGGYARGFMYSRNHNPNRNEPPRFLRRLFGLSQPTSTVA